MLTNSMKSLDDNLSQMLLLPVGSMKKGVDVNLILMVISIVREILEDIQIIIFAFQIQQWMNLFLNSRLTLTFEYYSTKHRET